VENIIHGIEIDIAMITSKEDESSAMKTHSASFGWHLHGRRWVKWTEAQTTTAIVFFRTPKKD
jgi:hypothetical protein